MLDIIKRLVLVLLVLFLISCNESSKTNGAATELSLHVDQLSSIPLINGQSQTFYVSATNTGTATLSDIQWGLASNELPASGSLVAKVKSKLGNLLHKEDNTEVKASSTVTGLSIVNTSECKNVEVGRTCRVLLSANRAGIYQLQALSDGKKITLLGGEGIVQVEDYPTINTGGLADVLTMTQLRTIVYTDGVGSGSFFIINNSESNVALDWEVLMENLPPNVSIEQGACPDPLPGKSACQIRVKVTNPSDNTNQELDIPIKLKGEVIESDGSRRQLPEQNGDDDIGATNKLKGVIQYPSRLSMSIDNSFASVTTASVNGFISNTGNGPLTITSLLQNGDVLSISNDTCSGKTLGSGEICRYTVNLNVDKISATGHDFILINYVDEAGSDPKNVTMEVHWNYIAPLPLAEPNISLTLERISLNQEVTSTVLTIANDGNVDLSNITKPIISPPNPRVSISDGSTPCKTTLMVGNICNYVITYSPSAPSETISITLGGIRASHPNNRGANVTTNFENSIGLNLSSTFAGVLSSSSSSIVTLGESTQSGVITFTNTGNGNVTISNVAFEAASSANLRIVNNGCQGNLLPKASCNVTVGLNNTQAGSGNGTLVVTYDNNNGVNNATSSNSNISWRIGSVPGLRVVFMRTDLVSPITLESSTLVVLTNDGNTPLNNIVIPQLSAPLRYTSGSIDGCATSGTQNLGPGQSCTLILTYSPTVAQSTHSESLPSFSATYQGGVYTTQPYSVTVTGLSRGDLDFSQTLVSHNVDWVNKEQTTNVTVTNVGGVTVTMSSVSSNNGVITTQGCGNGTVLQSGESCTLRVIGNYTQSTNGSITLNYTDVKGSKSETLNVEAAYRAMPVVTPGLTVSSPSLFNQNLSLGVNRSHSYEVTLTNTTTATNGGLKSISIPYASLMPSNGNGATYSINTNGISNNACNLPAVGGNMEMGAGKSCSYNLVISTGSSAVSSTQRSLVTNYNYNKYESNSLTPKLTGAPRKTNYFNLAITSIAQLKIAVESGQNNRFVGIERGLSPAPTMRLNITNIGTGPVLGVLTPDFPSGISGDFSSCSNLAVNSSCTVTLTMSTANTIASANLNTRTISYNNGVSNTTVNFPSINYSVVTPDSPVINMAVSVIGCVTGNGTSSTCMNNPDNVGGSASSMKVRLQFTNSSKTTAATRVSLPTNSSNLFTSRGYTLNSNTCNSTVAANGGTCVMEYNMPSTASTQPIQPNVSSSSFGYNYSYRTPQGQNLNGSITANLKVNINVVNPVMSIAAIDDILQGDSRGVTINLSNLYQTGTPSVTITPISGTNVPTFSSPSCSVISSYSSRCTFNIATAANTGVNNYTVNASSFNGNVTATRNFTVSEQRLVIFVSARTWDGNLGGFEGANEKCTSDPNKPATPVGAKYKALLMYKSGQTSNATIPGRTYYRSDRTTVIAKATSGFLASSLDNAIGSDDTPLPRHAWTGAASMFNYTCNDWTTNDDNTWGDIGLIYAYDWRYEKYRLCNESYRLFCVQQP